MNLQVQCDAVSGAWLSNWGVSRTIDCNLKFFFPGHSIQSLATATTSAPKLESKEQSEKVPHYFTSLSPLLPPPLVTKVGPDSNSAVACDVRKGNAMWAKLLRLRFGSVSTMPQHANLHGLLTHTHAHTRVCVCMLMCFYVSFMYICCVPCSLLAQFIIYYFHCHENLFSFFRQPCSHQRLNTHPHTHTHTLQHTLCISILIYTAR